MSFSRAGKEERDEGLVAFDLNDRVTGFLVRCGMSLLSSSGNALISGLDDIKIQSVQTVANKFSTTVVHIRIEKLINMRAHRDTQYEHIPSYCTQQKRPTRTITAVG